MRKLSQKSRRQQCKISKLEDLLRDLQSKNLLAAEPATVMEKCFDSTILDLVRNELSNSGKQATGKRYSQEVKQFAATLRYYSPQAYEYCKSIFSLPNSSSIRNWISNVECEPGFLSNVLDICSNSDIKDYSLVLDSMSLKKQTHYVNGKYSGFCDYGGIVAEDSESLCSEALVFLLVPLQFSQYQYPVGYFLVDKVNARVQTELVNSLLHITAERNIRIRNITCDGAAANQTMFKLLGCTLDPADPKAYFPHPVFGHNIYATLDICHMIKLARNALADGKTFFCQDGQRICWEYVVDLFKLQDSIGLHVVNKLTTRHVNWHKQKMKVKLAAQTFSSSVADALQFLHNSGIDGFKECAATIEFIRQVTRACICMFLLCLICLLFQTSVCKC